MVPLRHRGLADLCRGGVTENVRSDMSDKTGEATEDNAPLFSIIVPVYNRESLVLDALNCVLEQTYRPIELIVVDDGSTDQSAERVAVWKQRHETPRFSVRLIQQENGGAGSARSRGLDNASGRYVQFLDSDDLLHPNRVERLTSVFESEGCDFIQTGFQSVDATTNQVLRLHHGNPNDSQYELALKGRLWANTLRIALSRELAVAIGPWKADMLCFEDREYMERAVSRASHAVALKDVLATARRGSSGVSSVARTREGRACRIYCEEQLAESLAFRHDASPQARSAFKSRLYGLALRSRASGWRELADQCGQLAETVEATLDYRGRLRRRVWKTGFVGCWLYNRFGTLKNMSLGHIATGGRSSQAYATTRPILDQTVNRQ